MRLRILKLTITLLLLVSMPITGIGCSDDTGSGDSATSAEDSSPVAFEDGGEDIEEFQLALELMVFSHLDAYTSVDELLAWVPSESSQAAWDEQYSTTEASIARAQAMADEFASAVAALDDAEADTDADGQDSPGSESEDSSSLLDEILGVERAYAVDPAELGRNVSMQLNYDGVADSQQKLYTGPSQLAFQTGLVAEFDSLQGDKNRWQTLADRYNTSVAAMSKHVSEGRAFLQSNLDNDVMYTGEAANIAKAVELSSDVALFAASGGGTGLGSLVRRYGLKAALAETVAKEGVRATAVKAMQYGSLAIDTYELGTAVVFNEEPGPLVTDVKSGLGALQSSHTFGKLLLDPKTTMLDPGNLKTIKGWADFLTEVPEEDLPPGVFETDAGLVAGPLATDALSYDEPEALTADQIRSMIPSRLEEIAPLDEYAPGSADAGTYEGSLDIPVSGMGAITVQFNFTIDESGAVSGGWEHSAPLPGAAAAATYNTSGSFSGTAEDGLLSVNGSSSGSVTGPFNSSSGGGAFTAEAPITDGEVSGTMSGSGFGYPFVATKK